MGESIIGRRALANGFELNANALARAIAARATNALIPRWIFLRALGLIFFSAFYSFAQQVHGLIGERGILPAGAYLQQVSEALPGAMRFWYAPSVFWFRSGDVALTIAVAIGILCSLLLVANVWPRAMTAICTLVFLSFIATLQDFASYQSDGMLLEAGFISIFFAPSGFRPGLGALEGVIVGMESDEVHGQFAPGDDLVEEGFFVGIGRGGFFDGQGDSDGADVAEVKIGRESAGAVEFGLVASCVVAREFVIDEVFQPA